MGREDLKAARKAAGLTQQRVAERLGVSQAYWAFLESGRRRLTGRLARKAVRLLNLAPTLLPLQEPGDWSASELSNAVAGLGYPGFAWLRSSRKGNPAVVLVAALRKPDLEARLVEALPWLVARYPDLNWDWVLARLKLDDAQNRLGFLLRLVLDLNTGGRALSGLAGVLERVERARLAREDTLCRESMSEAERAWLRENRPPAARHWNLLTDLRPEHLSYAV